MVLTAPSSYRDLFSEFHVIPGTIASTLSSVAAATNWMAPPYEPPTIPISGSPDTVVVRPCAVTQSMIAETSRPSKNGESICNVPPESYSPRGSQVTTLKPSSRIAATPGTRCTYGIDSSHIEN